MTRMASFDLKPVPRKEEEMVVDPDMPGPRMEEEMAEYVGEPVPRVEEEMASKVSETVPQIGRNDSCWLSSPFLG